MLDRYNIAIERDTQNTLTQTQTYLKRKHGQYTDNDEVEGHDEQDRLL
jgi:hypothetical protein